MSPALLFYSDPRRSGAQLTTHPAVFGSSGAQRGCRRRIEKESLTNFPLQPLETNLGRAAAMRRSPLERRRRHQLWSLQCQPPRLARSVDGRARARRHVIPDLRVAWRGVRHQTDQASWRRKKKLRRRWEGSEGDSDSDSQLRRPAAARQLPSGPAPVSLCSAPRSSSFDHRLS
jgi:hypothetical protein